MPTALMSAFILSRSLFAPISRLSAGTAKSFFSLLALMLATVFGSSISSASGLLQVSPVTVTISADDRAGIVTVSSTGQGPMNAQARIFKWTQTPQDEYVLEPTNDLLVSPPIMQLVPGVPQELRVIRTQAASDVEQQYRLIIDQLPSAEAPSAETAKSGAKVKKGLSILVRHNLPVFLNSTDRPVVPLQWRARAAGKDKTHFSISNNSKNRAQIARVWLQKGDESTDLRNGLTGYVLPGSTIEREFDTPLAQVQAAGTQLKALINGTETTIQLGN